MAINAAFSPHSASIFQKYVEEDVPAWNDTPSWREREKTAHLAGKIITATGAFLAVGAIASPLFFNVIPICGSVCITLIVAVICGKGIINLIAFGVRLRKQEEFWNDPAYKRRIRTNFIACLVRNGYNVTRQQYGTVWKDYSLIKSETIRSIILEQFYLPEQRGFLSRVYEDNKNSLNLLISDCIFKENFLFDAYCEAIREHGAIEFVCRYVCWDLFEKSWFTVETEIEGRTIRDRFREEIATCQNLKEILQKCPKGGLQKLIFTYKIVTPEVLREKGKTELTGTFSDLSQRFLGVGYTPWDLLDLLILAPESLHDEFIKTLEENDFKTLIDRYGWKLFKYEIISTQDEIVRIKFNDYLSTISSITGFFACGLKDVDKPLLNAEVFDSKELELLNQLYKRYLTTNQQAEKNKRDQEELQKEYSQVLGNLKSAQLDAARNIRMCETFSNALGGPISASLSQPSVNSRYQREVAGAHTRFAHSYAQGQQQHLSALNVLEESRKSSLNLIDTKWTAYQQNKKHDLERQEEFAKVEQKIEQLRKEGKNLEADACQAVLKRKRESLANISKYQANLLHNLRL